MSLEKQQAKEFYDAISEMDLALSTWVNNEDVKFPDYVEKAYQRIESILDVYCDKYDNMK